VKFIDLAIIISFFIAAISFVFYITGSPAIELTKLVCSTASWTFMLWAKHEYPKTIQHQ